MHGPIFLLSKPGLFVGVNVIDSDDVIGESSEELASVGAPGQSGTWVNFWLSAGGLSLLWSFNNELGNWVFGVRAQIKDLNTIFASSSDPLVDWVESDLVDWSTSAEASVFFREVAEVPDLEVGFLTSGGDVVAQRSDGEGVNVFFVGLERVLDQEV